MNFDELGFKGKRFNLSRQTDTHYALAGFKLYFKKVKIKEIFCSIKTPHKMILRRFKTRDKYLSSTFCFIMWSTPSMKLRKSRFFNKILHQHWNKTDENGCAIQIFLIFYFRTVFTVKFHEHHRWQNILHHETKDFDIKIDIFSMIWLIICFVKKLEQK